MSDLSSGSKRVYRAAIVAFVAIFLATMWPIYPFFSRIFPMFLGIPFSFFYLVCLSFVSFLVLIALYLWENSRGELE